MAQCKDCIHNNVCEEVNSLKCQKDFIWYDAKSGCLYFTADVVPKSEVERLQAQNADLDILVKDLRFRNKELQKANEGLAKKIEELEIENDTVRGAYLNFEETSGLKKAKSEVAREIFAEIEQETKLALESNYKVKSDAEGDNDGLVSYVDGKIHCLRGLTDFITELKKKYTE